MPLETYLQWQLLETFMCWPSCNPPSCIDLRATPSWIVFMQSLYAMNGCSWIQQALVDSNYCSWIQQGLVNSNPSWHSPTRTPQIDPSPSVTKHSNPMKLTKITNNNFLIHQNLDGEQIFSFCYLFDKIT